MLSMFRLAKIKNITYLSQRTGHKGGCTETEIKLSLNVLSPFILFLIKIIKFISCWTICVHGKYDTLRGERGVIKALFRLYFINTEHWKIRVFRPCCALCLPRHQSSVGLCIGFSCFAHMLIYRLICTPSV